VCLVPAGYGARQVKGFLVVPLSLREVTADPVQRPCLVESLGLGRPDADGAEDVQRLFERLSRGGVITRQPPDDPQVCEAVGLAKPVAEVAVDVQRLFRQAARYDPALSMGNVATSYNRGAERSTGRLLSLPPGRK
jgi:hypothetical protein